MAVPPGLPVLPLSHLPIMSSLPPSSGHKATGTQASASDCHGLGVPQTAFPMQNKAKVRTVLHFFQLWLPTLLVLPVFFQTQADFSLGKRLTLRTDLLNLLTLESVHCRECQGVSSEYIRGES